MISPGAVAAIARNTLAEAIRDRILYGLLAFAIGLILLSAVLSNLTLGHSVRVVTTLSLSGITAAGSIMATLLGVGSISREIDKRTAYSILSKPISRLDFLLGKYLGVMLTVGLNVSLMAAAATLMITQYQYVKPFQYPVGDYLTHLGLLLLRMGVIAAIAVALSTVASSTVALIATLGLTVAAHMSSELRFFLGQSEDAIVRNLGSAIYYAVPDFSLLDALPRLLHGQEVFGDRALFAVLYAMAYGAAALSLGLWAFSRRDLA